MKYIALLRGINVGGQKKILMKDLTALFEEQGFTKVKTYIQSGNVVFSAEILEPLDEVIQHAILVKYGWEVQVLVRTAKEIKNMLNNCPFSEEIIKQSYFTLLKEAPEEDRIREANTYSYEAETYVITPSCVYFYAKNGYGRVKMSTNWWEQKLKVPATSRNYRTLKKLLELSAS